MVYQKISLAGHMGPTNFHILNENDYHVYIPKETLFTDAIFDILNLAFKTQRNGLIMC